MLIKKICISFIIIISTSCTNTENKLLGVWVSEKEKSLDESLKLNKYPIKKKEALIVSLYDRKEIYQINNKLIIHSDAIPVSVPNGPDLILPPQKNTLEYQVQKINSNQYLVTVNDKDYRYIFIDDNQFYKEVVDNLSISFEDPSIKERREYRIYYKRIVE